MKYKFITLGLITLICCKNPDKQISNPEPVKDTLSNAEVKATDKSLERKPTNKVRISSINKVKVLSEEKITDKDSPFFTDYSSKCEKWSLQQSEMEEIILKSKIIDGQEFQYYFDVLPCSYEGRAILNDSVDVKFEINSGSSTTLIISDTAYFLGYYGKRKYFISKPGIQ